MHFQHLNLEFVLDAKLIKRLLKLLGVYDNGLWRLFVLAVFECFELGDCVDVLIFKKLFVGVGMMCFQMTA